MGNWENAGESSEWYTPKYIFDAFGMAFELDAAAPEDRSMCHVPANRFITSNSLSIEWERGFTWLNPPFGSRNSKGLWLDKMHTHGNGICLVPDRSSADWWQKAALECTIMLMVKGKIKFIRPDGSTGDSPSTGTTLFGYGPDAFKALRTAETNGLGICLINLH